MSNKSNAGRKPIGERRRTIAEQSKISRADSTKKGYKQTSMMLSPEIYDLLLEVKAKTGKSMPQLFAEGLRMIKELSEKTHDES